MSASTVALAAPATTIIFEVPGTPQPQGSSKAYRRGDRIIVTSDNVRLRPWRDAVCWNARVARGRRDPITGPVAVEICCQFARPTGHFGKRGLLPSAPAAHTVKPDVDKLARAVLDAISDAGIWRDDSQVADLRISKDYGTRPGVRVLITEISAS